MTDDDRPADVAPTGPPGPPSSDDATTRTFLIADIRGYTVYTREHGDEKAAELAARFAGIVREVIASHDGFLVELRGDEALVVFVSARRALRAAVALQDRFATDGLERGVGIGLDSGEAIPIEGGFRGTALNLAARLCAEAGPGQIIASEGVIHLAATVEGISYLDPRTMRLKGYDEPVRAVTVMSADQAPRRSRRGAATRGPDRRMLAVGGVGLFAVVLAAVGVSGAFGILGTSTASPSPSGSVSGSSQPSPSEAGGLIGADELPALALVDPESGTVTKTRPIGDPYDMRFIDGYFWVWTFNPNSIHQLDPDSLETVRSIPVPLAKPGWWTVADGTLWVADLGSPRVLGIDVATQVERFDLALSPDPTSRRVASGVAVGSGSLWVSLYSNSEGEGEIVRLDPATGTVQARITGLGAAHVLAFDEDVLWAMDHGTLRRIDPTTNKVTASTAIADEGFLWDIAFAGDATWTADEVSGTVHRIDRAGRDVSTQVGVGAIALATIGATVWAGIQDSGRLVGIDAVTGDTRTIDLGHGLIWITSGNGKILVAMVRTAEETVAGLTGDVLTIAAPLSPFTNPSPDPPTNGSFEFRQAMHLTCASLLRYQDAPAPAGWELIPEAAAAMPDVSPDGRTYTFIVRDGFRFSPPSTEPLTAETFRYSIERALSPRLDAGSGFFLSDIEGSDAYRAGLSDRLSGISADGERLTIRLEAASGDFLQRLSMPYFCPVPLGTPVALGGLDPIPPVASAGPYYFSQHLLNELMVMKPNPNYGGDRKRPFDAIAWRIGLTEGQVVSRVESGQADAAVSVGFARAKEYGPGSTPAAAGDQRWIPAPRFGTTFLWLNPARLFADPAVRRAVSLAIDRTALAEWWGTIPFAGLLPPSVPGSHPADEPVPAADPDPASALLAGRSGRVVIGTTTDEGCKPCVDLSETVAAALERLGLDVEVRRLEELTDAVGDPSSEVDIVAWGMGADHPDGVAMMAELANTGWIGQANLDELERLRPLTGQERIDGVAALATRLTDDAYVIPFGYDFYAMYLGEDLGCAVVQPAIGAVDLLSLCRKP